MATCNIPSLELESGEVLQNIHIEYHTQGTYTPETSKVIWVCHALTANAEVNDWWAGLFGKGAYFDSPEYFVVCANILGSCYGTTGPLSIDEAGKPYLQEFPLVTPRDMAAAHAVLRQELAIEEIHLLIGSSLGGQQAQEFAFHLKNKVKNLILIATNAFHSPFGIAFNEAQRLALLADPSFVNQEIDGGRNGLIAARSIAMLSYRSYSGYQVTQHESDSSKSDDFKAASYQRYQGAKLANRFNAYSYWTLSKAMDAHNMGRNRESVEKALSEIQARTLVIGISSDLLFPVSEQEYLATHIPKAQYITIDSEFGHDGFLVETQKLEQIINGFLSEK
jgi:homoserine O-acetyltransferase